MSWYRISGLLPLAMLPFHAQALGRQELTMAPPGPFHVEGNKLLDSRGQPFLIRGTALPEFRTRLEAPGAGFGAYSATVFSSIRLRWNLNAVRLPLNLADYSNDPQYLQAAAQVIRRANLLELAVIVEARGENQLAFWRACAAFFKDYPQLLFQLDDAPLQEIVKAVRAGGARQPILVDTRNPVDDHNAIYMVHPRYRTTRTDEDRDRQFAELAARAPVVAGDLDPGLDQESAECSSFPVDPSEAEALVEANLQYFDAHSISWVASEFRPGKLIREYRNMFPSTLENGWTCGRPEQEAPGIGEMIQFHLWGGELRGLFAVSSAGGFVLARGAIAIVYGGIFAEADTFSSQTPLPTELASVSVLITDREGVTWRAPLSYVSAGWGQANVIIPAGCAVGPARLTVSRRDGSSASTPVHIADVAPGLWTARLDGRGPVEGFAGQTRIARCDAQVCSTIPIPVSETGDTTVRLLGSGIRHAAGLDDVRVMIGGVAVPVISFGPTADAGLDQITVRIPPDLRGVGETDLLCSIHGELSNVVRINMGQEEPVQ